MAVCALSCLMVRSKEKAAGEGTTDVVPWPPSVPRVADKKAY